VKKVRKMAFEMKEKWDKYWANINNINLFLFIALVLDPRKKWSYMEWIAHEAYEKEKANLLCLNVEVTIRSLFEPYDES